MKSHENFSPRNEELVAPLLSHVQILNTYWFRYLLRKLLHVKKTSMVFCSPFNQHVESDLGFQNIFSKHYYTFQAPIYFAPSSGQNRLMTSSRKMRSKINDCDGNTLARWKVTWGFIQAFSGPWRQPKDWISMTVERDYGETVTICKHDTHTRHHVCLS